MRVLGALLLACLLHAQGDRDLSGAWKLVPGRSEVRDVSPAPTGYLKIAQSPIAVSIAASASEDAAALTSTYPLNGKAVRSQLGDLAVSIVTKWEGTALLANLIVTGRQDYSVRERWSRSADGNSLTVERTVSRPGNETESTLVYENPTATVTEKILQTPAPAQPAERPKAPASLNTTLAAIPTQVAVPAGTRILLRLTNAVNTKHTAAGDRLYLETAVPVFIDGRLVIPLHSYVTGTVLETKRAGRVKGVADLNFRFDTLTLPNGVTRDFRSRAGSVDTAGNLDRAEGRITGESGKGGDARKVAQTTAAGAGIGTLAGAAAGHVAGGLGIGAAAGAIGGLAGILGSRGADVVLPPGTSMEMVLDRDILFTADELRRIR